MGKLKFFGIMAAVILFGGAGATFVKSNDSTLVAIDMLFAGPYAFPLGQLILLSFFIGLVIGALLCVAYVFIQSLELRKAVKNAENYKKQLDQLRSQTLKDAP